MMKDAELVAEISKLPKKFQAQAIKRIAEGRGGSTSAFKQFTSEVKRDKGNTFGKNLGKGLVSPVFHPIDTAKQTAGAGLSFANTAFGAVGLIDRFLQTVLPKEKRSPSFIKSFAEKGQKEIKSFVEKNNAQVGFEAGNISQYFLLPGSKAAKGEGFLKALVKNAPKQTIQDISLSQSQNKDNSLKQDVASSIGGQVLGSFLGVRGARKLAKLAEREKKSAKALSKLETGALTEEEKLAFKQASEAGTVRSVDEVKAEQKAMRTKKEIVNDLNKPSLKETEKRLLNRELFKYNALNKELKVAKQSEKDAEVAFNVAKKQQKTLGRGVKSTNETPTILSRKDINAGQQVMHNEIAQLQKKVASASDYEKLSILESKAEKKAISSEDHKLLEDLTNKIKESDIAKERIDFLNTQLETPNNPVKGNLLENSLLPKKNIPEGIPATKNKPFEVRREESIIKNVDGKPLEQNPKVIQKDVEKPPDNPKNKGFFSNDSRVDDNSYEIEKDNFVSDIIKNSKYKTKKTVEKGSIAQGAGDVARGLTDFESQAGYYERLGASKYYRTLRTSEIEAKKIIGKIKSYGKKLIDLNKKSRKRVGVVVLMSQGKDVSKLKNVKKLFKNGKIELTKKEAEAFKDIIKGVELYARSIDSPFFQIIKKNIQIPSGKDINLGIIDNYMPISIPSNVRIADETAKTSDYLSRLKEKAQFVFSRKKDVDVNKYQLDYGEVFDGFANDMGNFLARGKIAKLQDIFKDMTSNNELVKKFGFRNAKHMKDDLDIVLGQAPKGNKIVNKARKFAVWKYIATNIMTPLKQFIQPIAIAITEDFPRLLAGKGGLSKVDDFTFNPEKIGLEGGDLSYADFNKGIMNRALWGVRKADKYSKAITGKLHFNSMLREAKKAGKKVDEELVDHIYQSTLDKIERRFGSAGGVSMPAGFRNETAKLLNSFTTPLISFAGSYVEDIAKAKGVKEVSKEVIKATTALAISTYIDVALTQMAIKPFKDKTEFRNELGKTLLSSVPFVSPIIWAAQSVRAAYNPIAVGTSINDFINDLIKASEGKMSYEEVVLKAMLPRQILSTEKGIKALNEGGSLYNGKFVPLPKKKGFDRAAQIARLLIKGDRTGNDNIKSIRDRKEARRKDRIKSIKRANEILNR